MRISCDPQDPGFHPGTHSPRFVVTLDGKITPHAVTADEELGLVHVIQASGGTVALRGNVRIESIH